MPSIFFSRGHFLRLLWLLTVLINLIGEMCYFQPFWHFIFREAALCCACFNLSHHQWFELCKSLLNVVSTHFSPCCGSSTPDIASFLC
jgi:hypothetical protein